MKPQLRSLLLAGILPVVAFTVIEEYYGVVAGLVAGMVFGVGEIIWEKWREGRVSGLTWGGNGLLLVLGGVSLFTQEGLWFKLQPAIMEFLFAGILLGSVALGKPLMVELARKQGTIPPVDANAVGVGPNPVLRALTQAMRGMTLRMGALMLVHGGLTVWAALYWSTAAWAWLKGAGLTGSIIALSLAEAVLLRRAAQRAARGGAAQGE